jgi:chromosome segregation ATPase
MVEKILNILKIPIVIIGIIFLLFIFLEVRSCANNKQNEYTSELKGQYEAYKEKSREEKEKLKAEIQEGVARILDYQKEIIAIREERDTIAAENLAKDVKIEELEYNFSLLSIDDRDEKIENLKQQVGAWKDKFTLARQEVETWKAESKRWQLSYEEQVQITESFKRQLRNSEALLDLCEKRIVVADKEINRIKTENRIGKVLFAGAVLGLIWLN